MSKRETIIFAITSVVGLGAWVAITIVSGKEEAWDSLLFFTIGLPVMLCASGVAGYKEWADFSGYPREAAFFRRTQAETGQSPASMATPEGDTAALLIWSPSDEEKNGNRQRYKVDPCTR